MSTIDVMTLVLSTSVFVLGILLFGLFMKRELASNRIQHERTLRYIDVFPRISGLFLEPDIQSLPPAAQSLRIRETIAQSLLISGQGLEQRLLQYVGKVEEFHAVLGKPGSEEVATNLHVELTKLVGEIGHEMRHEIGMDEASRTVKQ